MENEFEATETEQSSGNQPAADQASEIQWIEPLDSSQGVPGADQVYKYLIYGLSIPERTVRSTAAMVGGAVKESTSLLVPQAFQDSKTYNTFVSQMIDLMANDVGGVAKKVDPEAPQDPEVEQYVAKKTVSTFVDLAGMATLHVSPLTILAIVSDVAYGSKTCLNELTVELKREGIVSENSVINSTAELLDSIGAATAESADVLDTPPLNVEGLRETIEKTRTSVANIDPTLLIPQSEIALLWTDMEAMAAREGFTVFEISSAMTLYTLDRVATVSQGALTTVRVTGNLIDRHVFDHYRQGLNEINERGIYSMLAESSQPYFDAVWNNFSVERPTITEDFVSGKMIAKAWDGVKDWLGGEQKE